MTKKPSILFITILAVSALFVAVTSAIFSITGLSHFFAGASVFVIIMASSLELGKVVAASFLYRFWDRLNQLLKIYLIICVVILVGISSMGIFGFLSKAYQGSTFGVQQYTLELTAEEERLEYLTQRKKDLQKSLSEQLSELSDEHVSSKRLIREQYVPSINKASEDILKTQKRIANLKQTVLSTGVDVGPLIYVARAFNVEMDVVAKWLIFILIIVFDPLALSLIVGLNMALKQRSNSYKEKETQSLAKDTYNKNRIPGDERKFQKEAKEISN